MRHTAHPDIHEHGLADGCPRCSEIAERPAAWLDAESLAKLRDRVVAGVRPRSAAEARAMDRIREVMQALQGLA